MTPVKGRKKSGRRVYYCENCGAETVPINSEAGKKALEERRAGSFLKKKEKKKEVMR